MENLANDKCSGEFSVPPKTPFSSCPFPIGGVLFTGRGGGLSMQDACKELRVL